jgi:hypothetical protein
MNVRMKAAKTPCAGIALLILTERAKNANKLSVVHLSVVLLVNIASRLFAGIVLPFVDVRA